MVAAKSKEADDTPKPLFTNTVTAWIGIITSVFKRSNPRIWNQQQIKQGMDVTERINALKPDPNPVKELAKFRSLLALAQKGQ